MKPNHIHLKYLYKEDLTLNNQQWLVYNKTKPNQTKKDMYIYEYVYTVQEETLHNGYCRKNWKW